MLKCACCMALKPKKEFYVRCEFTRGYTYSCKDCVKMRERNRRARKRKAIKDGSWLPKKKTLAAEGSISSMMLSVSLNGSQESKRRISAIVKKFRIKNQDA